MDKCYLICNRQVTWSVARENCLKLGMDLVAIETNEEFAWLKDICNEDGNSYVKLKPYKLIGPSSVVYTYNYFIYRC